MSIEILTVGLDEATIDKLADRIVARLGHNYVKDEATTESNPPAANTRRTQTADESAPTPEHAPDDPWMNGSPDPDPDPKAPAQPEVKRDKFGRTWKLNLDNAPVCDCGEPAAQMRAKSQKGNYYTMWKCAHGAPDGDWRNRCEYGEF